jgi:hypothetical protein
MDQFGPIVLVGCPYSHNQECDRSAGVRPVPLGGMQFLHHQIMELRIIILLELLADLIDFKKNIR